MQENRTDFQNINVTHETRRQFFSEILPRSFGLYLIASSVLNNRDSTQNHSDRKSLSLIANTTTQTNKEHTLETPTKVRFFIEQHPENLGGEPRYQALMRILTPETCNFLESHGWGVSIAMIEPDQPTATLIKSINQQFPNLPISAWVVLDDKEGYWTNRFNISQTRAKVEEIKAWANHFDLSFEAMGFDLEMPIELAKSLDSLFSFKPTGARRALRELYKTGKSNHQLLKHGINPESELEDLIRTLKKEGIKTHSYELPFPLNTKLLGVVLVQSESFDMRSTMVYTSGIPNAIQPIIPGHVLKDNTYPAIGIFNSKGYISGRDFGHGKTEPQRKQELFRDIRILAEKARKDPQVLQNLWVFALDGVNVAQWTEEALQKNP